MVLKRARYSVGPAVFAIRQPVTGMNATCGT